MGKASMCEELINELGGQVDSNLPEDIDFPQQREDHPRRRRADSEEAINVDGSEDKRFKENETEALSEARHMVNVPEGETDGRGQVTDPENDLRLKKNLGKRAKVAAGKNEE